MGRKVRLSAAAKAARKKRANRSRSLMIRCPENSAQQTQQTSEVADTAVEETPLTR